jgi:tRNA(Ile)-lysidine synthase
MVHLFHSLGLPAGIVHCNFGLRGAESDGDEAFVRELARQLNFPFFVTRPDVKSFAKSESVSTQMAARELRYEWFEKVRQDAGYTWIATAHHANDSLETLLLNLTRGTGLPGLCGIAPINGSLIRPLLFSNREEVGHYAAEHGILWREDRTNQTDDYNRNKVRHRVIPVLSELNPSLEHTFNASSERLRAANSLLDEYLQKWKTEVVQYDENGFRVPIQEILNASESIYRLWSILLDFDFQYSQMRGIANAMSGTPGKRFLSPSHTLLVDREYLVLKINKGNAGDDELTIERPEGTFNWKGVELSFRKLHGSEAFNFDKSTIAVDAGLLVFPLTLRTWKQGDIFQPFGMGGKSKKVSDLLIDSKMDRFQKEKTGVLLNGNGDIIWIVGVRADERFRVGERTADVLVMSLATW